MDIKENLALNLASYRKSYNLTQAELAEKLNYTDKAVSKWERGESVPDLYVLKQLADFYNVTIDALIGEPKKERPRPSGTISKKRATICLCCTGLVWLVAILCFALLSIIIPEIENTWLAFIYAMPITFIIILVLTAVWKKKFTNMIIISFLLWSSLLAVFLTLINVLPNPPKALWMIFLIGIPLQALTIFWYIYRKLNLFDKNKK